MAMQRLNDRWCGALSLDDFAEFGETPGESCFTDKGLGPTLLQQLLLAHDTVAVLEEVEENLKHFGFYRHELSRPPQLTACLIEGAVVKVIEHSTLLNLIRRADERTDIWEVLMILTYCTGIVLRKPGGLHQTTRSAGRT
jgi:hypothetical protein